MGGETLEQDYLRRIYDKYVAGVNKPSAEGKPAESAPSQFDRVIRPQNVNPKSRKATAEYHYQNGLHEFGPAFATKFVATHLKALRDEVAQEFLSKATMLQNGAEEPRSITYGGERYYRPDVAREMRDAGAKGAKEYSYYDPTQGEKFPHTGRGPLPRAERDHECVDGLRSGGNGRTGFGPAILPRADSRLRLRCVACFQHPAPRHTANAWRCGKPASLGTSAASRPRERTA